jgi:hypothetical protein
MKNKMKVGLLFSILVLLTATVGAHTQKQKKNLTATATAHSITLNWVQSVPVAGTTCPSGTGSTAITGNNIYRGLTAGGEGTAVFAPIQPGTTFTDTNATTPGQSYFYKVTAVNCQGESVMSNEASGTIPNSQPLPAPTGLSVTAQ